LNQKDEDYVTVFFLPKKRTLPSEKVMKGIALGIMGLGRVV
jgi:hypothetical protein